MFEFFSYIFSNGLLILLIPEYSPTISNRRLSCFSIPTNKMSSYIFDNLVNISRNTDFENDKLEIVKMAYHSRNAAPLYGMIVNQNFSKTVFLSSSIII